MLKTLVLAAGLAVATFSAQAATMKAVYTSVITYAEVYKGGNGLKAGDHVTTTYIYNTNAIGIHNTGPTFDLLNSAQAIKSVTLAYNGWSYSFAGNGEGIVAVNNNAGPMEYYAKAYGTGSDGSGSHNDVTVLNFMSSYAANPPRLDAPASAKADFQAGFGLDLNIFVAATGEFDSAYAEGLSESVTISAVPLPASLPLLMAGFGGLAALRRRTAKDGTK